MLRTPVSSIARTLSLSSCFPQNSLSFWERMAEGLGEGKMAKPALDPHLVALARKLRQEQTNAEQLL